MPELLLELLSEDIPARMQARAAEDLKRLVTDKLKDAGLAHDKAEAYVTPRRLVLVVDGLPDKQPDLTEKGKGPRVDAPEEAIHGFLGGSLGISLEERDQAIAELEKRPIGEWHHVDITRAPGDEVRVGIRKQELKKGLFYVYETHRKGRPTVEVLAEIIGDAVRDLHWPKSMRWSDRPFTWVRPLHNVLAAFNGRGLQGDVYQLTFTLSTRGHRFLAPPKPITIKNFAEYKKRLEDAHVILDPAERRKAIWKEAQRLAKAEGLTVKADDALLAEVAGLVEWPKVFMGRIDEAFMDLPAEVLTTVMRHHQKYFSLVKKDGSLAPRFIVVADTEPDDGGKAITAGNERVLKARLADARFFWDHDRKATLESRVPALEGIIFHAKLGTLAEKVARIQALAAELAPSIPDADVDHVRRAALLSKADLTTEMVKEFPELQGVMGRYYALGDGERPEVAEAVAEHYAPLGPGDRCPAAPVSVAVALADKIDSLVGFFAIGERPTGSKDPFALRRAALGIIRLILENQLRIPLRKVFELAKEVYSTALAKAARELAGPSPKSTGTLTVTIKAPGWPDGIGKDVLALLAFFADRLKVHLREKGVRHDLIDAVFAPGGEDDLVRLMARVESLRAFLDTEDGEHLLTAYKRAANIVRIEEKRDGVSYDGAADARRFKQPEERDLYERLGRVKAQSGEILKAERFDDAMKILAGLRKPVDVFFDEVTVNCDEAELRENRLKLLSEIRTTMNTVADFSQIEG